MIRILAMALVVVMTSQGVAVSRIVESGTVNDAGAMRKWQWEYEQTRAERQDRAERQEVCGVASKEDVGVEGKKEEDEGVGVMEEVKEGLVKFTEWFVLSIVVPVGITVLTRLLVAGAR